jgi:hypothetical protein
VLAPNKAAVGCSEGTDLLKFPLSSCHHLILRHLQHNLLIARLWDACNIQCTPMRFTPMKYMLIRGTLMKYTAMNGMSRGKQLRQANGSLSTAIPIQPFPLFPHPVRPHRSWQQNRMTHCYGTVRIVSSSSIRNTMDNELTYSVMNQDVAWRKERDKRRKQARYWYKQSLQSGEASSGNSFRLGRSTR